jgi:hypothetical protein
MRLFLVISGALLLSACGTGDRQAPTSEPGSSSTTVPSRPTGGADPAPTSSRGAPRDDPEPTRLTAGPVLIRLTGTPTPTKTDSSPQTRYVLIFRLSRGYKAVRNGRSYGWFEIAGTTLDPLVFGRRGAHCFAGVIEGKGAEDPAPAHILDRKRPGERVQVRIRPLTKRAGKNEFIEHPYLRHPRILVSAVRSVIASYNLRSPADFTSPSARRAIRTLRCTSP